jgi:hypothetical protein
VESVTNNSGRGCLYNLYAYQAILDKIGIIKKLKPVGLLSRLIFKVCSICGYVNPGGYIPLILLQFYKMAGIAFIPCFEIHQ